MEPWRRVELTAGSDDVPGLAEESVASMAAPFFGKKEANNFRAEQILIPKSYISCFFDGPTASLRSFLGQDTLSGFQQISQFNQLILSGRSPANSAFSSKWEQILETFMGSIEANMWLL